jgi:hypothetical protein
MYEAIIFHHSISCSLKCIALLHLKFSFAFVLPMSRFVCTPYSAICGPFLHLRPHLVCALLSSNTFFSYYEMHAPSMARARSLTCVQSHCRLHPKWFSLTPIALMWKSTSDYSPPRHAIMVNTVPIVKAILNYNKKFTQAHPALKGQINMSICSIHLRCLIPSKWPIWQIGLVKTH